MQPRAVTARTPPAGAQKAAFPPHHGLQLSLCVVQVAFGVFPALLVGIGRRGWGVQALRSGSASARCQMGACTGTALETEVSRAFVLIRHQTE